MKLDSSRMDCLHDGCVSIVDNEERKCTDSAAILAERKAFNRQTYVKEMLCVQ